MEKNKVIHLEKANTLSNFLTGEERENIVSLKITGYMGRRDFVDVLDEMCHTYGEYDDDDNYTSYYEISPALRHLDMGEATYVDGDSMPYFGFHTLLETAILPKGIKYTTEDSAPALSEAENLRTLVLPEGVKVVDGFNSCPKLTGLVLPEGVKVIASHAFCGCEAITSIRIPASVSFVDEGPLLLVEGKLNPVTFPATLKKVPGGVFNYSSLIKEFKLAPANPFFMLIGGALCSKDGKTIYSVPDYNRTSYQIPEGIEVIAERAFSFLPMLQTINLPTTLRVIKERVFQSCNSLLFLEVPTSVEQVDIDAFWASNLKSIVMKSSVPPEMTGNVKDNDWIYKDTTLFVPADAVSAYKAAPGWKCFIVKPIKE